MGIIRKSMSITSGGLVDFRSDKERTAAYTKAVKKQAKKQTKLLEQQTALQAEAHRQTAEPAEPAPTLGQQLLAAAEAKAEAKKAEKAARKAASTQPPAPTSTPAAWYPDQQNPGMLRWFDGTQWTNHTAPANQPPPPQ